MPILPISKKQLDKLGDRLRDTENPSTTDLELLEAVLGAYDEALQDASTLLRTLGFHPTVRLKTTGTIVDKLRRERSSSLKTIQDLAGARVILNGTTRAQDDAVEAVCAACSTSGIEPVIIDRRADPRAGYRAVHVILKVESIPVEVQFRTELQDFWAQIFERLADAWGRQIRYGGPPDADTENSTVLEARTASVKQMMAISALMANLENMRARIQTAPFFAPLRDAGIDAGVSEEDTPPALRQVRSEYLGVIAQDAEIEAGIRSLLTGLAEQVEREARSR